MLLISKVVAELKAIGHVSSPEPDTLSRVRALADRIDSEGIYQSRAYFHVSGTGLAEGPGDNPNDVIYVAVAPDHPDTAGAIRAALGHALTSEAKRQLDAAREEVRKLLWDCNNAFKGAEQLKAESDAALKEVDRLRDVIRANKADRKGNFQREVTEVVSILRRPSFGTLADIADRLETGSCSIQAAIECAVTALAAMYREKRDYVDKAEQEVFNLKAELHAVQGELDTLKAERSFEASQGFKPGHFLPLDLAKLKTPRRDLLEFLGLPEHTALSMNIDISPHNLPVHAELLDDDDQADDDTSNQAAA